MTTKRRGLWLLMLALVPVGLGSASGLGQEDELARELPRVRPTEPADALKTFRLHAGFRLEPIAVEPLVTDPVSLAYDADGRLYVVEMRGYPYPERVPSGRVRRLEDTDNDGRFDAGTTFVDGLSWPTSVVPYDGGVFIAMAPEIIYAKDTNGDGVADLKRTMFTGFGTQNVQALVNGLLWGPDGWIYGVSGGNGGEIKNVVRPEAPAVSVRGRDFRFRPDGSAFEAASGGGQFGHAFDDWGHRFTCNNSNHIRQIVLPAQAPGRSALVVPAVLTDIAAEGPAAPVYRISPPEPWRVVRTRQRAADPEYRKRLSPTELVAAGFFTSATGVTIYRGSAFPAEYRGNAFIGDVGGNLVHRKVLARAGSIFRATRADEGVEFLASTDTWFRPVSFANTPDGTLVVLDMYRETIEHPASIPEPIKRHLDLTSGHDRGRLYHLVPDGFRKRPPPRLSGATTAELVGHLADPDAWWRETAQRLLVERKDPSAILRLRELVGARPTALARVHALWTLDVLGGLRTEDLREAATDPEPGVREQVARLAEGEGTRAPAVEILVTLATMDADPMVILQAALSLGKVAGPQKPGALFGLARKHPNDPWIRAAVLSAAGKSAAWLLHGLLWSPEFVGQPGAQAWLEDLAVLVGAANRSFDIRNLLTDVELVRDMGRARAILSGLGRGLQQSGNSLRDVLARPEYQFLGKYSWERASQVAQGDGDPGERIEAIRLLGLGPIDRALAVLPPLLDARQPGEVQLAALQALGAIPDRRVGPLVVGRWKELGPAGRREAAEVLFARADRVAALLDAVEAKQIAPADLDPGRRQQLLSLPEAAVRQRAAALFGAAGTGSDRARVIAEYRQALDLGGDSARGRLVFAKTCAACHKAEGRGADVGPDLATVVGRTPEDLLIQILDPNREVPPAYLNYTVATTDGRVLSGLIAGETAGALTLKRAEGLTDVVPRDRIEAVASSGLSLMPEGLEQGLDSQAMADLIAFLRGLGSPGVPGGR